MRARLYWTLPNVDLTVFLLVVQDKMQRQKCSTFVSQLG